MYPFVAIGGIFFTPLLFKLSSHNNTIRVVDMKLLITIFLSYILCWRARVVVKKIPPIATKGYIFVKIMVKQSMVCSPNFVSISIVKNITETFLKCFKTAEL
jgi:hypothetical protein